MKIVPDRTVLALSVLLWLLFPASAFSSPLIEARPDEHDFGQLQEGPLATTSFEIRNLGDADLNITTVRTSCGCTGAVVGNRHVPPGDKTQVEVIYRTEGRPGPFKKLVSVQSDDPTSPNLLLEIRGNVIPRPAPSLALPKPRVAIPPGEPGTVACFSLSVTNRGQEPLEIRRVASQDGQVVLWAKTLTMAPGETRELPLKLTRPAAPSKQLPFRVESNDPRRPMQYFFVVQEEVKE